jgi:HEAT repeat protein
MIALKELRWTTRAEVCEQLWQWLLATSPTADDVPGQQPESKPDRRDRVAELFATIALESWLPALRQLLRNRHETKWARREACRALVRLRALLPTDEITSLMTELRSGEQERDFHFFAELLPLFDRDESRPVALTCLEQWTPLERAELLVTVSTRLKHLPPKLANWLYQRWLDTDRLLVEDVILGGAPLNFWIVSQTSSERPESLRLLVEHWRGTEGEWRKEMLYRFEAFEKGVPAEWLADKPDELRELAEALRLSVADLIAYFGAEPLMARIEEGFRDISRTRRADPSDWSVIHEGDFKRMVHLMATWPEPDRLARIRSLFGCPDIETEVRWEFCYSLRDEHRADLPTMVQAAAQQAGDLELAERVLRWVADAPVPADRDFLRWGAWQEGRPRLPYYALQGLEALGEESPEWTARLEILARSDDPFLRLQASVALARHGDAARLPEVVRDAAESADACVRGEAVRALGQLRREEYLPLFRRAPWDEQPGYIPAPDVAEDAPKRSPKAPFIPAAEEAALAIARLGTPEALTALLQGFLFLPETEARWQLEDHLEVCRARIDGREEPPFDTTPWVGWRQEFFGRLP